MKADVVIPNYNGREALELCVESIARLTPEPHRVIVCDDGSTYPGDRTYLDGAKLIGAVDDIIYCYPHRGHGAALNVLLNGLDGEHGEYVAVLDNDIQVLKSGWLSVLIQAADAPNVLTVCDHKDTLGYCSRGYRPGMYMLWFGLIKMAAYRDGMQTDWAMEYADRNTEPWRTMFAPFYPPEENEEWRRLRATQSCYSDFDAGRVVFDPGTTLWAKLKFNNPGGYTSRPLTPALRQSFRHWGHGQSWLDDSNSGAGRGAALHRQIRAELKKLREG